MLSSSRRRGWRRGARGDTAQQERSWQQGLPGVGDGCVLSRQGGRGRLLAGWRRAVCQTSPCREGLGSSAPTRAARRSGCCFTQTHRCVRSRGCPAAGHPVLPHVPGGGGSRASARSSQHLSGQPHAGFPSGRAQLEPEQLQSASCPCCHRARSPGQGMLSSPRSLWAGPAHPSAPGAGPSGDSSPQCCPQHWSAAPVPRAQVFLLSCQWDPTAPTAREMGAFPPRAQPNPQGGGKELICGSSSHCCGEKCPQRLCSALRLSRCLWGCGGGQGWNRGPTSPQNLLEVLFLQLFKRF